MLLDTLPPLPDPLTLTYGPTLGARVRQQLDDYTAAAETVRQRIAGDIGLPAVLDALNPTRRPQ